MKHLTGRAGREPVPPGHSPGPGTGVPGLPGSAVPPGVEALGNSLLCLSLYYFSSLVPLRVLCTTETSPGMGNDSHFVFLQRPLQFFLVIVYGEKKIEQYFNTTDFFQSRDFSALCTNTTKWLPFPSSRNDSIFFFLNRWKPVCINM